MKNIFVYFFVLSLFVLSLNFVAAPESTYFHFTGYTYDVDGNPLNNTNVSVEMWGESGGWQMLDINSTLTNASGFFNLTVLNSTSYFYKPVIYHFNGSDVDYVGKSLPTFDYYNAVQILSSSSNKFYLKEGATLNITVSGNLDLVTSTIGDNAETYHFDDLGFGLEWDDLLLRWIYFNTSNYLIKLDNTSFTTTSTYTDTNFNSIVAFDSYNNRYYFVNFSSLSTGVVYKYLGTSMSLTINGSFVLSCDGSPCNYTNIYAMEYDPDRDIFWIVAEDNESNKLVDMFSTTFDRFQTVLAPDLNVSNYSVLEYYNNNLYYISLGDSGSNLYKWDGWSNSFELKTSFDGNVSGLATDGTNWYYSSNSTGNITNVNVFTDIKSFRYSVKDSFLGYHVAEDFTNTHSQVTVYVPSDQNYSIMVYPDESFPLSLDVNNLSEYDNPKHADLQLNSSMLLRHVSGYVSLNGTVGFTDLDVIPYLFEAGDMIYNEHPLPYNMSVWNSESDLYNLTTGFYNITLPGVATGDGISIMMFVSAVNGSNYYGGFRNITLNYSSDEVTEFNISVVSLLGSLKNISVDNAADFNTPVNVTTKALTFVLQNNGSNITTNAHLELNVDYSDYNVSAFTWMGNVDNNDNGSISFILYNYSVDNLNIYSSEYAPLKKSFTALQLASSPVYINLTTFNPSGVEEELNDSDIFVMMYKSNEECSVPYPAGSCNLFDSQNFDEFNPISIVISGGNIDFAVGLTSRNITVKYVNVNLLASGPPDAMFDSEATSGTSGTNFENAWRFGSLGPEIYDYVLVGVPYSDSGTGALDDSQSIRIEIPYLYDDDWNTLWNRSAGDDVNTLPTGYEDYNIGSYAALVNGTGVVCNTSDITMVSSLCYVNTSLNILWLKIPHFSGIGPEISGTAKTSSSNSNTGSSSGTGKSSSAVAISNETIANITTNVTPLYNNKSKTGLAETTGSVATEIDYFWYVLFLFVVLAIVLILYLVIRKKHKGFKL
jgi:hypothetical protein